MSCTLSSIFDRGPARPLRRRRTLMRVLPVPIFDRKHWIILDLSIFGFQSTYRFFRGSGDGEIRTLDPLLARQVLSQLSYTPGLRR